ncbi:MAG: TetR/AcrR family transcriptional regulator [Reyranella sp.]|uniref:TetR/AcrR family transcriptional regulator n=1 Tax=Reyranella sp. TaxID=1929291 RepID=UPI001ACD0156|nr:TetR/AcrR family transcriptional regulator [Reyranella sp.]MBN9086460.1 TetR/AcrR family transcriptional regulator [Reyranella sp.]
MTEQAGLTTAARSSSERAGRREQNKAENRAALLKAARTVFAEMGYGAAGVRDIVRRTDLASGTFYNYFKDKAEIFEAVVREMSVEIMRRHRGGRARARTAEEFFRSHISTYITFVVNEPEVLAFGRANVAPIRALIEKPDLQVMSRQLVDDITAAMERGVLPRVDPAYLAAALSGVVFEISVAMAARDPVDTEGAIEFATRMMMGGIANLPKKDS